MFEKNSEITMSGDGGQVTVRICGEIDHHSAPVIRERIDACIDEKRPKSIALDLSGVSFMDSSGLGLVLGRYKKASRCGCTMTILDPSRGVDKIFSMAGLERIIKIERKRDNERKNEKV